MSSRSIIAVGEALINPLAYRKADDQPINLAKAFVKRNWAVIGPGRPQSTLSPSFKEVL